MTPDEREMLLEMPAVQELLHQEREACARLAETCYTSSHFHPGTNIVVQGLREYRAAGDTIASVIRARGRSSPPAPFSENRNPFGTSSV